jgi:predicted nuclease with TOPRIM domain
MDNMNLENAIAVAGTVGAIVAVIIRAIVKSEKLMQADPEDDSMLGQSLDVTATQTEMMRRLMDRVDENERTIAAMATRLQDLETRNAELETYKNQQADQISRLRARVAQLEHELRKNDLTIPEPPLKVQANDNTE